MTAETDFECRGCDFMEADERDFVTRLVNDWGAKIDRRFDTLDAKIDNLQNGHAELDKNQAVTASQLESVKGSVARLGERMGKAEVALATAQGSDQAVTVQKSTQFNWTALILTTVVAVAGIVVTILLTSHGGK